MSTAAAEEAMRYSTVSLNLFNDGLLLQMDVSYWRGMKPLRPEDVGLQSGQIADFMRLGRKRLVPKEEIEKFSSLAGRAHYIVDQRSFPFPLGEIRFIPNRVLDSTVTQLQTLKVEWERCVADFLARYGDMRDSMLTRYPTYAKALEERYPSVGELTDRFEFSWTLFELAVPSDLSSRTGEVPRTLLDLDGRQARRQAFGESLQRYRSEFQGRLDGFLDQVASSLRAQVAETCKAVQERVERGDTINTASVRSVRGMIDRFRDLDFLKDTAMEEDLRRLEASLPTSAEDLRDEAVLSAFGETLNVVLKTAKGTETITFDGEYRRKVRF